MQLIELEEYWKDLHMEKLGYYNGNYGPLDEMTIPMNDRASWFGDGVYDAGPCRNYHIFALDEHVDRFFRNAHALQIIMPVSKEELKELLNRLVQKMDTGNLFVYYQVTRGTGTRKHAFTEGPGNLWIKPGPGNMLSRRARVISGSRSLRLKSPKGIRLFSW